METYFPIIVTILLVYPQTYFVKKRKMLYAFLLPIIYTISIITYINNYDLAVVSALGNIMFYLMAVATFITRPRFKSSA